MRFYISTVCDIFIIRTNSWEFVLRVFHQFNAFNATDLFDTLYKQQKTSRFSDVFKGYRKRSVA